MTVALTADDRGSLDTIFECATHGSSSGEAARRLLFAWGSASVIGGLDLTLLWRFDVINRRAALGVFQFILDHPAIEPCNLIEYADRYARLRALHDRLELQARRR